jgi:hypothetical protein
MTLEQPAWDRWRRADREALRELEFIVLCASAACGQPATVAVQCRTCRTVTLVLCVAHERALQLVAKPVGHACGVSGSVGAVFAVVSLGEWFPWQR